VVLLRSMISAGEVDEDLKLKPRKHKKYDTTGKCVTF
jgi:hypothetical protein